MMDTDTDTMSFEEAIELRQISPDAYESLHQPWTWPASPVIPGGFILALAAHAAYLTLPVSADGISQFSLDNLSCTFLSGASPALPMQLNVTRLSDGGRFITRGVNVEQKGRRMVTVTMGFVNPSKMGGTVEMRDEIGRGTGFVLPEGSGEGGRWKGTDLAEEGEGKEGGRRRKWMKFMRLGVTYTGHPPKPLNPPPHSLTYTSVGLISSFLKRQPTSKTSFPTPIPSLTLSQLSSLALLPLSDYHLLDAPPVVHSLEYGMPPINPNRGLTTDKERAVHREGSSFSLFTTLTHSVQFVHHPTETGASAGGGPGKGNELPFDANREVYVEAQSDWAGQRRGGMRSKLFQEVIDDGQNEVEKGGRRGKGGRKWKLIAVCMQEGYFVMKEPQQSQSRQEGKGKL